MKWKYEILNVKQNVKWNMKMKYDMQISPGVEEIIVGGYTYNPEFISFVPTKSFSLNFLRTKTNNDETSTAHK